MIKADRSNHLHERKADKMVNEESTFLEGLTERTRMFLSESDLDKIRNQVIAQAGFGGIGSIVLELMVRLGVMKFRLLDMDKYDMSNMNRQIFAVTDTIGAWKSDVAAARIKEINPYAEVEISIIGRADKKNTDEFVKGADIFILGTDSPSSVFLFHESARKHGVPLIDGHCISVTGGSLQVFDYRDPRQVCKDRIFRSPTFNYMAQKILGQRQLLHDMSDEKIKQFDEGKVATASLNFVTNMIGCMVACEVVKLITGQGKTYLYPKEIYVDLFDPKMKIRSARSLARAATRLRSRFLKKEK